jgi:diacylglycerol kinase (ATP)
MPRRVAVVVNPASVADSAQLRKEILQRCAALAIGEPLWFETTKDDPGAGMVGDALSAGADLIVVCGGDGTVAACAGALPGSDVALGVVACGSGNLLARNLDLPLALGPALDVAFGCGRRRLDLLESAGRRFVVMAGLGFDAEMIRGTSEELKAKVGWPAYLIGIARALRGHHRARFDVTIDDAPAVRRTGVGVLVGNVGQLQGSLAVLPDAQPDDGLLDVVILMPRSIGDWPVLVLRILLRKPDSGDQAEVMRGRRVRISTNRPLPVEYDGEAAGEACGMTVQVLPAAILICSGTT